MTSRSSRRTIAALAVVAGIVPARWTFVSVERTLTHLRRCLNRSQRAALGTRPPVYVVDGHGDALQHWEALPQSGYSVLHIDSHADMFLDFQPSKEVPGDIHELSALLSKQVHLSNFIPLGILSGKVDRVIWLRSDFPNCRYNGPPPGQYDFSVGAPELPAGSPPLVYWQRGGKSFTDYSFMPDPLQGGYEALGGSEAWPPVEKNSWWEKVPYLLDDFGLYLLGEPMGTPYAPAKKGCKRDFGFSVLTDGQLVSDTQAGSHFLSSQLADRPWVLDVDLDFFATLAPALAPVVRRLQLTAKEANTLGYWSQALASGVQVIEEEDPGCQAFRLPILSDTVGQFLDRGGDLSEDFVATLLMDMGCVAPPNAVDHFVPVLRQLSDADRAIAAKLTPEELDVLVASPHGPHHVSSREEVIKAVASLEAVLSTLPKPEAVTVARSTDLYLPLDLGPFIEEEFLKGLVRLGWASSVEEAKVVAPAAWPS